MDVPIELFDRLPGSLKEELERVSRSSDRTDQEVQYTFDDWDTEAKLLWKIRKCEKTLYRTDYRRSLERTMSGGLFERSDIREIYEAQEGRCYYTGERFSLGDKNYSIDHIKPVRSGGSSWPGNLALVIKSVNQEKHDMSRQKFLSTLEARYGADWIREQKISVSRLICSVERSIEKESWP